MPDRFHQFSTLEADEQERAKAILRARGALTDPPPSRGSALLCGCPVNAVEYAIELCTHRSGEEHTTGCVQWCSRCSEGDR